MTTRPFRWALETALLCRRRRFALFLPVLLGFCAGCGAAEGPIDEGGPSGVATLVVNRCPEIGGWLLLPDTLKVGDTTHIYVDVHDLDAAKGTLRCKWASLAGSFSDPATPDTEYTCERLGRQALFLNVTDDRDCRRVLALDVQCVQP